MNFVNNLFSHVIQCVIAKYKDFKPSANLKVWYAEFVVSGEVLCACGGCHHFVPCLLAGLFTRSRDQPKLSHVFS